MASERFVVALHSFPGKSSDELPLIEGNKYLLIKMDEEFGDGWWEAEDQEGNRGIFPASHVELLSKEVPNHENARNEKADVSISTTELTESSSSSSNLTDLEEEPAPKQDSHASLPQPDTNGVSKPESISPNHFNDHLLPPSLNKRESSNFEKDFLNNHRNSLPSGPQKWNDKSSLSNSPDLDKSSSNNDPMRKTIDDIESALQNLSTAEADEHSTSPLPILNYRSPSSLGLSEKIQSLPHWSTAEVIDWLKNAGLGSVAPNFMENEINGEILLNTDSSVLKELNITSYGKRFEVLRKIQQLKDIYQQTLSENYPEFPDSYSQSPSPDLLSPNVNHSMVDFGDPTFVPSSSNYGSNNESNASSNRMSVLPTLSHMLVSPDLDEFGNNNSEQYIPPLSAARTRGENKAPTVKRDSVTQLSSSVPSSVSPITKRPSPSESSHSTHGSSRLAQVPTAGSSSFEHANGSDESTSLQPPADPKLYTPQPSATYKQSPNVIQSKGKDKHAGLTRLKTDTAGASSSSAPTGEPLLSSKSVEPTVISPTNSTASSGLLPPASSQKSPSLNNAKNTSSTKKPLVQKVLSATSVKSSSDNGQKTPNLKISTPSSLSSSVSDAPSSAPLGKEPIGKRKSKRDIFGRQKILPTGISEGLTDIPAKEALKTADCHGWMRKRSDRYGVWKARYFVLKGTRLSYYHSLNDTSEKGLIDITSHRVCKVEDLVLSGGKTAIKLAPPAPGAAKAAVMFTPPKVHYFICENKDDINRWSSAFLKATVERDMSVPVLTTTRMQTISLNKAKELRTRPPSLLMDEQAEPDLPSSIGLKKNAKQKGKEPVRQPAK
ncbi:boi family protein [Schizosaccharomyces octosporus yFS286]|uniref:Boi family protein n=1 Tax=Schizosaccharomyces octosporus (strain yFS286) TaxID=483514 RepID=S9RH17_SCHOY|nr:boi family protein [Schizosaccharomyces octosporus yFS286]EPX73349.1 boi family protein [Schizosaccharomyces octosporus yFS286]